MERNIMEFFKAIASSSQGSLLIVLHPDSTNAHYLCIGREQIGRDIEVYGQLVEQYDWVGVLLMLLQDVMIPLRYQELPEAYEAGAAVLRKWGNEVYEGSLRKTFLQALELE